MPDPKRNINKQENRQDPQEEMESPTAREVQACPIHKLWESLDLS